MSPDARRIVRCVNDLVPGTKYETEAAERAVQAGWPAVEPVVERLLAWVQDLN
jgi:hypothetical protein